MPTNNNQEDEKKKEHTVDELLVALQQALSDKAGVKFADKVRPQDILQAAWDFITSSDTRQVASSVMRGREYGVNRQTIINKAAAEYDAGGKVRRLTDRDAFVNGALHEAGLLLLTDDERRQLVL